jgi:hypothetical protein
VYAAGMTESSNFTDAELVEHLRRAASIWFKDSDLLALEELLQRYALATRSLCGS